jgi:protein phosphatase methylesterase 1
LKDGKYVWKTDLKASKVHWEGWFKGMNEKFLATHTAKQIIFAASERMDKELTVANMQGKFKFVVIPEVGHAIQEDGPKEMAAVIEKFIDMFKIPEKYA